MTSRNEFADKLLSFFQLKNKQYTLKELHKMFDLTEDEIECFDDAILELQKEGKVYLNDHDEYGLFPVNTSLFVGQLKVNKKGKCYVAVDDKPVYIYDNYLKGAIKGDYVLVNKDNHSFNGKVKKVLYRDTSKVIVDCVSKNGSISLEPYDKSFIYEINLKKEDLLSLVDGDRIALKLEEVKENNYIGTIIYHVGNKNDPNLDIKTLAVLDDIDVEFPKEVINEVNALPKEVREQDLIGREDFRRKLIYTIDGKDTKDMDDAISLEINEKGNYVLGVHIADVSHYIKPGSLAFKEAYKRGTSVYPANFVIPMFPQIISNGICSLNPKIDRLTLSCLMEIDKDGNILSSNLVESVINSKKKMSYEEVNKILEKNEIVPGYEDYVANLKLMEQLHNILNKNKIARGYLDFGNNDVKTYIDSTGEVVGIKQINRGEAEKIIEDFMLLANETVARNFAPIFRVHDYPDKDKMQEILSKIEELGFKIKRPKALDNSYAIQGVLKQISNLEIYPILAEMILQGMPRAIYTTKNRGHCGLALKDYTHFTSPIRRFVDLMVHTLIKQQINNIHEIEEDELETICNHCTLKQKQADDFEKKVNAIKAVEYIEKHKEEEFMATICYIGSKNLLLKTDIGVYGKLLLEDLSDKYKFNPDKMSLSSKDNDLYLGDKLIVKLKRIDESNKKIYFKECKAKEIVRVKENI